MFIQFWVNHLGLVGLYLSRYFKNLEKFSDNDVLANNKLISGHFKRSYWVVINKDDASRATDKCIWKVHSTSVSFYIWERGGEYVTERVKDLFVLQLVPSLSNSLYLSSVSVRGPSVHEQGESYLSP